MRPVLNHGTTRNVLNLPEIIPAAGSCSDETFVIHFHALQTCSGFIVVVFSLHATILEKRVKKGCEHWRSDNLIASVQVPSLRPVQSGLHPGMILI